MKNNIVLIGMPGVGKSTIGVILAKILAYHFLDSDLVIQEREGRRLHQIISEEGTDGFLKIENDVNASLNVERTIIATGGSAIYGKEAMEHLKEIGEVVYLKADYETIEKRLGNLEKRGVALKNGQTLKDLYEERTKLYELYADVTVDEKGLGTEETIGAVLRGLNLLDDI
jgi:shikimate kinase